MAKPQTTRGSELLVRKLSKAFEAEEKMTGVHVVIGVKKSPDVVVDQLPEEVKNGEDDLKVNRGIYPEIQWRWVPRLLRNAYKG